MVEVLEIVRCSCCPKIAVTAACAAISIDEALMLWLLLVVEVDTDISPGIPCLYLDTTRSNSFSVKSKISAAKASFVSTSPYREGSHASAPTSSLL